MALIIANTDEFLQCIIGADNDSTRGRISTAGFGTLSTLVKKEPLFAKRVCAAVRRSTGGGAANKDVPIDVEENMGKLILLARNIYMVQRPLDFTLATMDNLDEIESWYKQLGKNQPTKLPPAFSDALNKKSLFESLTACLSKKIGESGMPLDCVVRDTAALPLVDQGFSIPSLLKKNCFLGQDMMDAIIEVITRWFGCSWKRSLRGPLHGPQPSPSQGATMEEELS